MKYKIEIQSSTENSDTVLRINNIKGNNEEVLLTIESHAGFQDIFVLKESLIKTIDMIRAQND